DKNIAISELKKLIENCKGKSVETQFNKTNVSDGLFKQVTQQNLPQIRKQAVRNTNVIAPGPSRNCPKHVSHQSPREKVGSNDMVHNYYLEKAKKSAQLQKDKEVNGKPRKLLNSCTGKVDSEPAHGLRVDIPYIHAYKQTLGLSAAVQASVINVQMVSAENNTSGPAPFLNVQKTFNRSRSSLGLHGNDVCSHQFRPRSSSNDF
ncbi:hypothetical protein Tco_0049550, partial [Tanacetum coccineum]